MCQKASVRRKRVKKLDEEMERKEKMIQKMKEKCQTKTTGVDDKFSEMLQENEQEIQYLKNELGIKK